MYYIIATFCMYAWCIYRIQYALHLQYNINLQCKWEIAWNNRKGGAASNMTAFQEEEKTTFATALSWQQWVVKRRAQHDMECKAIEQADKDPIRTVATAAHDAGEEHVLHWHFFKTNDYRVLCTFFWRRNATPPNARKILLSCKNHTPHKCKSIFCFWDCCLYYSLLSLQIHVVD